jgi:hypothetical protein
MKDFDTWNTLKKTIEDRKAPFYTQEREIWYAHLGLNI